MRKPTIDKFVSGYEWSDFDVKRWKSWVFAPYHLPEIEIVNKKLLKKLSRINANILLNIHLKRSELTIRALNDIKRFILVEISDKTNGRIKISQKQRHSMGHDKDHSRSSVSIFQKSATSRNGFRYCKAQS